MMDTPWLIVEIIFIFLFGRFHRRLREVIFDLDGDKIEKNPKRRLEESSEGDTRGSVIGGGWITVSRFSAVNV